MDWEALATPRVPGRRALGLFRPCRRGPAAQAVGRRPPRLGRSTRSGTGSIHWPEWGALVERARLACARLINAGADEIAFIPNTTTGIGLIAEGYPMAAGRLGGNGGRRISLEPLIPWKNLAEPRRDPARPSPPAPTAGSGSTTWPAAIDPTTRVLTISHVEFASGFRNDLGRPVRALPRRAGVALFVDAIQGLGPLRIDVRADADRLPRGRRPQVAPRARGGRPALRPQATGSGGSGRSGSVGRAWSARTTAPTVRLHPQARRLALGGGDLRHGAAPGVRPGVVDLFLEIGPEVVSRRILERAEAVRERARSAGWSVHGSPRLVDQAGIVALEKPGVDPEAFALAARERGIALACRRGRVRVSPHVYNDADDLDRLASALAGRP